MEDNDKNRIPPEEGAEKDPADLIGETLMNLLSLAQMLQRSPQKILSPTKSRQPLATGSLIATQSFSNKKSPQKSATDSKPSSVCLICRKQGTQEPGMCVHVHQTDKSEKEQNIKMKRNQVQEVAENSVDLQKHIPLDSKRCPNNACKSPSTKPPSLPGVLNQDSSDTISGAKPFTAKDFTDKPKNKKESILYKGNENKSRVSGNYVHSRSHRNSKSVKIDRKLERGKDTVEQTAMDDLEPQDTPKLNTGQETHTCTSDKILQQKKSCVQQSKKFDKKTDRESTPKTQQAKSQPLTKSYKNSTKIAHKKKEHSQRKIQDLNSHEEDSNCSPKKSKETTKSKESQCRRNGNSLQEVKHSSASNKRTCLTLSTRYPPGIEKTLQVIASKLTKKEGLDTLTSPQGKSKRKETGSIAELIGVPKSTVVSKTPWKKDCEKNKPEQKQCCSKVTQKPTRDNKSSKRTRKSEINNEKHSILQKSLSIENSPEPLRRFSFGDSNKSGSTEQRIIHDIVTSSENLSSQDDQQDKKHENETCEPNGDKNTRTEIRMNSTTKEGLDEDLPLLVRSRRHSEKQQSQFNEETIPNQIENLFQRRRNTRDEDLCDMINTDFCAKIITFKNKEENAQMAENNSSVLSEDSLGDFGNKQKEPRKDIQTVNCKFLNFPFKLQCTSEDKISAKISISSKCNLLHPSIQNELIADTQTEKMHDEESLKHSDSTPSEDKTTPSINKTENFTTKSARNQIRKEKASLEKEREWTLNHNEPSALSTENPNNDSKNTVSQEKDKQWEDFQRQQNQASANELANKFPKEALKTDSMSTATTLNLDKKPTNSSIEGKTWQELLKSIAKPLTIEIPITANEVKTEPVSPLDSNSDLNRFPLHVDETEEPPINTRTQSDLMLQLKQELMDTKNEDRRAESLQNEKCQSLPIPPRQCENCRPEICIKQELTETCENSDVLKTTKIKEQLTVKEGMYTSAISNQCSIQDLGSKTYIDSTEAPKTDINENNNNIEKPRADENFNTQETIVKNPNQLVGPDKTGIGDTNAKPKATKPRISPIQYISEKSTMLPQTKNTNTSENCNKSTGSQDSSSQRKKSTDQPMEKIVPTEKIIPVIKKAKFSESKRTVILTDSFLPQISSKCSKASIKTQEINKIMKPLREKTLSNINTKTTKLVTKSTPRKSIKSNVTKCVNLKIFTRPSREQPITSQIKSKIIQASPDQDKETTDRNEKPRIPMLSSLDEKSSDDGNPVESGSNAQYRQRYPCPSTMYWNDSDVWTSPSRSSASMERESWSSREDFYWGAYPHQSTSRFLDHSWESRKCRSRTPPYIPTERSRSSIPNLRSTHSYCVSNSPRSISPIPKLRSAHSYCVSRSPPLGLPHQRCRSLMYRSSSSYQKSKSLLPRSRSPLYRFSKRREHSPSYTLNLTNTRRKSPSYTPNYMSKSMPSSRPPYQRSQSLYERARSDGTDTGQLLDHTDITTATKLSEYRTKTSQWPEHSTRDRRHHNQSEMSTDAWKRTEQQDMMGSHSPQLTGYFAGKDVVSKKDLSVSSATKTSEFGTTYDVDLSVKHLDNLKHLAEKKEKDKLHQISDTLNRQINNSSSADTEKKKAKGSFSNLSNMPLDKLEVALSNPTGKMVKDYNLKENKVNVDIQRKSKMNKPKLPSTYKGVRITRRAENKGNSRTNLLTLCQIGTKGENIQPKTEIDETVKQATVRDHKTEKETKISCDSIKINEDLKPIQNCKLPEFLSKTVDINLKNMTHIYASNGQQVCNSFNMSRFTGIGCPGTCNQLHLSLPLYDHLTDTDMNVSQTDNINVLKDEKGYACFFNLYQKMICNDFNSKEGCNNIDCVMTHTSIYETFNSYYERKLKEKSWPGLVKYHCYSSTSAYHDEVPQNTTKSEDGAENAKELEREQKEKQGIEHSSIHVLKQIIPCRYFNTQRGCRRWNCPFAHSINLSYSSSSAYHDDIPEKTTKSRDGIEMCTSAVSAEELEREQKETRGKENSSFHIMEHIIPCRYYKTPGGCRRWNCPFAHNPPAHRRFIEETSPQTEITIGKENPKRKLSKRFQKSKFLSQAKFPKNVTKKNREGNGQSLMENTSLKDATPSFDSTALTFQLENNVDFKTRKNESFKGYRKDPNKRGSILSSLLSEDSRKVKTPSNRKRIAETTYHRNFKIRRLNKTADESKGQKAQETFNI